MKNLKKYTYNVKKNYLKRVWPDDITCWEIALDNMIIWDGLDKFDEYIEEMEEKANEIYNELLANYNDCEIIINKYPWKSENLIVDFEILTLDGEQVLTQTVNLQLYKIFKD